MKAVDPSARAVPLARPIAGGIDIGGTKISAGVVTDRRELHEVGSFPTVRWDGGANLDSIRRLRDQLTEFGLDRVGLSLATTIDDAGRARDPQGYFGLQKVDLAQALSDESCTVDVFHDAASGAIAEQRLGAGTDAHHLLYITVGTGVSHCLVEDGRPYAGAHGMGYLSGYVRPAACGRSECVGRTVEDIVSGPAIANAYSPGSVDAREVCRGAAAGDARAHAILDHAAWHLGTLIADLMTVLDPDVVVVGGGLGHGADDYRSAAFATATSLCAERGRPEVPLRPSRFGAMSCWLGAAELSRGATRRFGDAAHTMAVGGR